jgi:hypothetical protein
LERRGPKHADESLQRMDVAVAAIDEVWPFFGGNQFQLCF